MHRLPELGRTPRLLAAALAAGITAALFGAVVSLGAEDHQRLSAAVASRQPADPMAAPRLVAAASAP